MSRIRRLVFTKWETGWEDELLHLVRQPAPVLETFWMPEPIPLPIGLFSSFAPRLRTLAVQLDVFDATVSYPSLRGVTRLHLLSHPDDDDSPKPLDRDILLHVLYELPNLVVLTGVTMIDPAADPMPFEDLMDMYDRGLRAVQAVDSPFSGHGMMESLHILPYYLICDVVVSRPSSYTLNYLFRDPLHVQAYTHLTLDRIRSQIVLRTEDGFTRALTECKAYRGFRNLHQVANSLTSLTLAGRVYKSGDEASLPAFPALRMLTIAVHSSDSPPSAMLLRWTCPCLTALCLASIRDKESISIALVETFITEHLIMTAPMLAELRLASVCLLDESIGDVEQNMYGSAPSLLAEKITFTSAILQAAKIEKYGP
ncbi:hypothetical protein EXIGLDRAFT_764277 [Exidia glandulosa HHB12029]|uniref:F-box domain-containing protein n=1 Tax=Exidia glandulosa HHB12029 TaxID=1314781 RepID=A0A165LB41_EXIGL|nr:hypothetical protein EXIGLDRAFT_764277 [Exidia glandulosa HHB12029]